MRSTSAAGNVFSIPKSTPIFFTFRTLSQNHGKYAAAIGRQYGQSCLESFQT